MRRLIDFYAPFVSEQMSLDFQRHEMLGSILFTFILAAIANAPLFVTYHWIIGICGVVTWFVMIYTLRSAIIYESSDRKPNGSLYIPRSVAKVCSIASFFFGFILTALAFLFLCLWTGIL